MSWTPISSCYVFALLGGQTLPAGVVRLNDGVFEFGYARSWLERPDAFPLDPIHLPLSAKVFVSRHMFGVLMDATPDNWGQRVLAAIHQQLPQSPIEWLLAARGTGAGCLTGSLSRHKSLPELEIPTVDDLQRLSEAVTEVDARTAVHDSGLVKLLWHGSSMGGARPKCTVTHQGRQWIAKFTRPLDVFNEARAEHACLQMARSLGIRVPETQLVELGHHTALLVERFDRAPRQGRKHYISAHSLLDMPKIREEDTRGDFSYSGIARIIRKISSHPKDDLKELYLRMMLNIVIGNTDDHLRNHGFLYYPGSGYRLSPAFDVLPHPSQLMQHAIGIGLDGRLSTIPNALSKASFFGITHAEALSIKEEVFEVALRCRDYFRQADMKDLDVSLLAQCCERHLFEV